MIPLIAGLTGLAATLSPCAALSNTEVDLRYRRPLGQVVEYRLSLQVRGEQVSLGERLPVRWRAELAFREEVIGHGPEGVLWLRVRGRPLEVEDRAGTLAGALGGRWPEVQVQMTSRGEILDVSLATGEAEPGLRERAFVALTAQPAPIVLPDGPVPTGDTWEWERDAARQTNRLIALEEEGDWKVARIASRGSGPLGIQEGSEALGLTTRLEGEMTQDSQLELLLPQTVALRHQGEMRVQTESEVALALPAGERTFRMHSDVTIEFALRLVSIDGQPVRGR